MVKPNRAGNWIKQPGGYRAFVPAPLPPEPPIRMTDKLSLVLSEASSALGRLDGSVQTLPNPDLFIYMYVCKEAVLSSQIEGTQSSLQDLLEEEAKLVKPDRPDDVAEIINYIKAMNHGLDRLDKLPVSIRLIREIHAKLMEGVRGSHLSPGEIRTSQNWIGPPNCSLREASFVPPPPQLVEQNLADLEKFIHKKTDLAFLIKLGLTHAQFENIHPFLDGNGRVGRLLITFLLCEQEMLHKPVLYLSQFFHKNRMHYYAHLQAVHDTGDWEAWLGFFLRGVTEVSKEASETVCKILALRERHQQIITQTFGRTASNGHKVLKQLYQQPIVSVGEVQKLIKTTYPAANNLVKRMTENGLLHELGGRSRNRKFAYQDYIDLFK